MGNCNNINCISLPYGKMADSGIIIKLREDLKQSYKLIEIIGQGGFGKVWKVKDKQNDDLYAMKEMCKVLIISKQSVHFVMNELLLLSQMNNFFIVNLVKAYQNHENLNLVMDLMLGGDLRFHIHHQKQFTEEQTKFFIACILQAIEYLHEKQIIHRDIKPENLVFDDKGYLKLTDFGIACDLNPQNFSYLAGTPAYMAPEVLFRQNYDFLADYYSLGTVAYECCQGKRPYPGKIKKDLKSQILMGQATLTNKNTYWSQNAQNFINSLIRRRPENRLGANGIQEVKTHPWFEGFDWQSLNKQEMTSPFIPNADKENFNQQLKKQSQQDDKVNRQKRFLILNDVKIQDLFDGYKYPFPETNEKLIQSARAKVFQHNENTIKHFKLQTDES